MSYSGGILGTCNHLSFGFTDIAVKPYILGAWGFAENLPTDVLVYETLSDVEVLKSRL